MQKGMGGKMINAAMIPDARRIRQSDLISESILDTPINIVGAGGIGSLTTLALAKVGFKHIRVCFLLRFRI